MIPMMEHPFAPSLENKTLEELQQAISDLTSKLSFAYRTGNSALIYQLHMLIESYRAEYGRKMNAQMEKALGDQKLPIRVEKAS